MNPEWMEWAAENMPDDMLKQMISSRNWDLEWRNNQIVELLAERGRLREALKDLINVIDKHAVMSFGSAEDNARAALQEDTNES